MLSKFLIGFRVLTIALALALEWRTDQYGIHSMISNYQIGTCRKAEIGCTAE